MTEHRIRVLPHASSRTIFKSDNRILAAMVSKDRINKIVAGYDKDNLVVATACSHTSLQVFAGAKREGFKTLGIVVGQKTKFYDAFPLGKPDEFMYLDSYTELLGRADELTDKNVVVVPHGSFVEYMTPKNFVELEVPTFGNRHVLDWESDRDKSRQWLLSAGIETPYKNDGPKPRERPVHLQLGGAQG